MLTWFQSLLPEQGRFFALFEAHADTVDAATHELQAMFRLRGVRDSHIAVIAPKISC